METQTPSPNNNQTKHNDFRANVDTSRPFSSVKEAVAIFGERLLAGDLYNFSPKPNYNIINTLSYYTTPSLSPNPKEEEEEEENNIDQGNLLETLKKLQMEFEETKQELKDLKEREIETEIAVASLNAELHKNMSKLAEAEAAEAKKAIETFRDNNNINNARTNLAHMLSIGDDEEENNNNNNNNNIANGYYEGIIKSRKERVVKKKPIIPLVGDLWFFKKKGSSINALHNSLFGSSDKIWS
ncbi:hypothetical protein ACFE04_001541 [Oxalis oulophora]